MSFWAEEFPRSTPGRTQLSQIIAMSGAILWSADYDAFGKADINMQSITNNLRFPGQYYDQESGLHYNYYRYYDTSTGRYITSDPIGLVGGLNTYGYVLQNPVNYIDPDGRLVFLLILPALGEVVIDAAVITIGLIAIFDPPSIAPYEMAKGGKEQGRNEYTDMARNSGQDPCEFLKVLKQVTIDKQELRKIKQAEKFMDCANKKKRANKHNSCN